MFCRFKGKDHTKIKTDVTYWLAFTAVGVDGQVLAQMPGMYSQRYDSFEAFCEEWEIV